jgi:hypothetical protein
MTLSRSKGRKVQFETKDHEAGSRSGLSQKRSTGLSMIVAMIGLELLQGESESRRKGKRR